MEKVEEFRVRATECRNLAQNVQPQLRAHYLELAAMWEQLADERLTFFLYEKAAPQERQSPKGPKNGNAQTM